MFVRDVWREVPAHEEESAKANSLLEIEPEAKQETPAVAEEAPKPRTMKAKP